MFCRRKLTVRITELEDLAEHERTRANNLEKTKTKLTIEIKDLQTENEALAAENAELIHRAKQAENLAAELQRRVDEMTIEINNLHSANSALESDNMRLKGQVSELTDRISNLDRENRQLSGRFYIKNGLNLSVGINSIP